MIIGIYKITSPTNRVYIGKSIDIERRWREHKSISFKKSSIKLYNSLQKYGFDQHQFEIIEECEESQLDEREIYYKQKFIEEFGWDNALFCELYDRGGGPRNEETKLKIRKNNKGKHSYLKKARKGKRLSKEIKLKMSLSHKGKKLSEAHKKSISNSSKGHLKTKEWKINLSKSLSLKIGRKILQYDLEDNFIKEWNTGKEAAKKLNLNYVAINNCCRINDPNNLKVKRNIEYIGKYRSQNYIWKYK